MSDQNNKINKKAEIDLAELLKKDAPYLVEDGKVNLSKLDGLLSGKITEKEDDRFYFNWAGKDKVFQAIQAPAYSTLAPQKDKSIGWDETENLMIVGENLETLKLLLKPYFGKVKVIYIDPPYNTGKDFIYKDDFSAPLKDYLERTGQKGADGERLTTNSETNGRYHSDWLNFMYPRLFVARNLLKEDGVIFVSIDDNEVHHLKMIMDEIFGEDNFLFDLIRKTKTSNNHDVTGLNIQHENTLVYAKNRPTAGVKGDEKKFENYQNPDNDPNGDWISDNPTANLDGRKKKNLFEIKNPHTGKIDVPPNGRHWLFSESNYHDFVQKGKIIFKKEHGENERGFILKRYKVDIQDDYYKVDSLYFANNDYINQVATKEIATIFGFKAFEYTKPTNFIKKLIQFSSNPDDLILDFFGGSGTTAQAVLELNNEGEGKRKFMLVQIAEPIESDSEAYQAGYKTISDICIERIKRFSQKNNSNFKVFELKPSNFNLKEEFELTENKDLGELKTNYLKELGLYVDQPTVATANTLDIVYEIILKNGFSLNSKIEELKLGSNNFYKVSDTENELEIHISLDAKIEDRSVEAIRTTEYKGKTFAFYDNSLTDSQKINLNTFVKLQVI